MTVSAVDYDEDPTVRFSIIAGDIDGFVVDNLGNIRTTQPLDREAQDTHMVVVRATDNGGHYGE